VKLSHGKWRWLHPGNGGTCPHFYKWLGTGAPRVRTKTRKWSNCTGHTEALIKTTDCTCKAKKVEGHDKKFFRRYAPDMCLPLLNSFQRRWIGLHRHHRHHDRLVHKKGALKMREWKMREQKSQGWKMQEWKMREWKMREQKSQGWKMQEHKAWKSVRRNAIRYQYLS